MAPQNVYDDPAFFKGYLDLRDSASGLNEALEQPAPAPKALAARPDLDLQRRRPPFLLLAGDRGVLPVP